MKFVKDIWIDTWKQKKIKINVEVVGGNLHLNGVRSNIKAIYYACIDKYVGIDTRRRYISKGESTISISRIMVSGDYVDVDMIDLGDSQWDINIKMDAFIEILKNIKIPEYHFHYKKRKIQMKFNSLYLDGNITSYSDIINLILEDYRYWMRMYKLKESSIGFKKQPDSNDVNDVKKWIADVNDKVGTYINRYKNLPTKEIKDERIKII